MISATLTSLIIFNARRGGEPSRLSIKQWKEAMRGEWIDCCDLPSDFESGSSLITFQTGKGNDHLVSVIFPTETLNAVKFLAHPENPPKCWSSSNELLSLSKHTTPERSC